VGTAEGFAEASAFVIGDRFMAGTATVCDGGVRLGVGWRGARGRLAARPPGPLARGLSSGEVRRGARCASMTA